MRKKRKTGAGQAEPTEPAVAPAPDIGTSLKGAIANWKQLEAESAAKRPKPSTKPSPGKPLAPKPLAPMTLPPPGPSHRLPVTVPPLSTGRDQPARTLSREDQNALERAFAGVRPLTERKRGGPSATVMQAKVVAKADDVQARARLDALVGRATRIVVERQEEYVSGVRDGVAKTALRRLRGELVRPEATLDLHGERAADVAALVSKFVRMQHKKGLRLLLIIVGKGHHSERGVGVLADPVIHTLSEGGAAPLVAAFTSAHTSHGGTGALMVELING